MVIKRGFCLGIAILSLGIVSALIPTIKDLAFAAAIPVLTFTESGITETVSGDGYTITDTVLAIKSPGTYRITGSCTTDCNLYVKKGTTGVILIFDNLSLSATSTAPFIINRAADDGTGTEVAVKLYGTSTLTDNESDNTLPDYEGAAIKVKSGSSLTFSGPGTLNVISNYKNGIKGSSNSSITFNGGIYSISSVNNGIAVDGTMTFNKGTFDIDAGNDGIKAVPDLDDLDSAGAIYINGGTFDIDANDDGIQAAKTLLITNGTFDIKAYQGYRTNCPTDSSCKGIKGSSDNAVDEPSITITGGTFTLDVSDDAIHSDTDITITRGTFLINSKEDAVHAERNLVIGTVNGYERDPEITVNNGFEGLEGEKVFIYSGKLKITTNNDGINAAGGGDPEGNCYDPNFQIYIYGGEIYINTNDDGIDSNGDIHLYGGTQVVFSQAMNGMSPNEALDRCGDITIDGATVFTAGDRGIDPPITNIGSSQQFFTTTTHYSANSNIAIRSNNTTIFNETIPKKTTYTFFSSPDLSTTRSFTSVQQLDVCKASTWQQTWNNGVVTTPATQLANGLMTYTSNCLNIERKTILYEPTGTNFSIINNTRNKATVTFGDTTSTSDFDATTDNNTLTVESNEACMVITSTDFGATYTRIPAQATNNNNIYTFNISTNNESEIYIYLAGDVTMNGEINSLDSAAIDYSLLSESNPNYHSLSPLESLLADVNYNGTVNSIDSSAIDFSLLSTNNINYKKLDWKNP
ncbi:carbohydrate-binding domain-containing protein [Candidatus Saccharibacteria bacterium]|nr:carbohydrate-binding domain-containing protein [Candidatus Saccharibacteria bacterium]